MSDSGWAGCAAIVREQARDVTRCVGRPIAHLRGLRRGGAERFDLAARAIGVSLCTLGTGVLKLEESLMRAIFRAIAILLVSAPAWALDLGSLSNADAAGGLKEALTQGAGRAVELLGRDGGFLKNPKVKIPLPGVLQQAEPLLRMAGRGKDVDQLVTTMNRAAEAAVPEAKALLLAAVKSMTVQDAKAILTGGDDSVTQYFRSKTQDALTQRFMPVVKKHTERLAVSNQYNQLAGQAAGVGLVKGEDAKIEGYVTRKALDGLYLMIAEEERAIRKNPMGAAGSLAKKVFGAL
jgi:hypothetical protein